MHGAKAEVLSVEASIEQANIQYNTVMSNKIS